MEQLRTRIDQVYTPRVRIATLRQEVSSAQANYTTSKDNCSRYFGVDCRAHFVYGLGWKGAYTFYKQPTCILTTAHAFMGKNSKIASLRMAPRSHAHDASLSFHR